MGTVPSSIHPISALHECHSHIRDLAGMEKNALQNFTLAMCIDSYNIMQKMDFSFCVKVEGFCRSSHKCKVVTL